jgi:predicted TIM-barrel fold metal-dependent hydrolase
LLDKFELFDSHFHIIDPRFPLVPNQGYLPEPFTCQDYLDRTAAYKRIGGAIVSGSFQAFDTSYLVAALKALGPNYVGVAQLPVFVSDAEIAELSAHGVRGVRFNLRRGGSEQISHLAAMAHRVHAFAGWHVELYVDSAHLAGLYAMLVDLPSVSVDHLGLSESGLPLLADLAAHGVRVKATGFGRVAFDVKDALKALYSANPNSLMFGTDLPSTRAPIPYRDRDLRLVVESLGRQAARRVFSENAMQFYRLGRGSPNANP